MRKQRKITTAASLIASKRIAIAFCAAVAMVLGAMSVGATMHFYPSAPDTIPPDVSSALTPTHANTTTMVGDTSSTPSSTSTSHAPSIITENKSFHKQSKLTPILISRPKKSDKERQPLMVVPNIVSQTSLTLGPLSVSANTDNDSIQLNTSLTPTETVQVPTSLPNILPSTDNSNASGGSGDNSGSSSNNTGSTGTQPTDQTPAGSSLMAPLSTLANTVQNTVDSNTTPVTNPTN